MHPGSLWYCNDMKIGKFIGIFYALGIGVHILVITKLIPYTWVNGGRSASYQAQAGQSIVSIVLLGGLYLLVRKIITASFHKKWHGLVLYVLASLWGLGYVMQLLGSQFERFFMSFVLICGFITHYIAAKMIGRKNV